jgi:trimethylamine--corrinoid protein Co-methyltransferase
MKKRSNYAVNETLQFRVFTESQCQEIHNATLEVMESVGAVFHDEEALALLKKAGAYVDGERVRFPAGLVEWAIRTAPSRIVLCDRNGGRKVFLEDHKTYFGPGPTNTYTLDPFTGEKRFPEISDSFRASKVIDALPNIDYQMDMGTPRNVPTDVSDIYLLEAMLTNSTKPIVHWGYSVKNYQTMVDMCVAIAGSLQELQKNPFLCLYSEPSSPFVHSPAAIQKAMFMARNSLPCIYTPAPSCGGTAPATLAGNIVVSNAECLAGLVVCQLVREGSPFIMGGVPSILDMKSMILSYGAPEFDLLHAGFTEMAHYYKIPMFSTAGCTDSKAVDEQAAIEATSSIMMAALSGANLIHDIGYMEYGATSSLELLVMDDEIIGHVRRIVEGIRVDEETLAVDVIRAVGPGNQFLTQRHTYDHFKTETWQPSLINRQRFDHWVKDGSLTLQQRVNAKVREIADNHEPEKMAADVQAKIRAIVQQAG